MVLSDFHYDQPITDGGHFFGESAIFRFLVPPPITAYFLTVIGWKENRLFSVNRQLNVFLVDIKLSHYPHPAAIKEAEYIKRRFSSVFFLKNFKFSNA